MSSDKIRQLASARSSNSSSSSSNNASKMMISLSDIEAVFVSKLSEKYDFTERGIAKAFKRFDTDNSGYLSVTELSKAIHLFVNGIDYSKVQDLVKHYDVDGDGRISLDEFAKFLLTRVSVNRSEWVTVDSLISQSQLQAARANNSNDNEIDSGVEVSAINSPSRVDRAENTNTAAYRSRVFLKNMKALLLKRAMDMRLNGELPLDERLGSHLNPLAERNARLIMLKEFMPYQQGKSTTRVNLSAFSRVLMKFQYPGAQPPSEDVLLHLFQQCIPGGLSSSGESSAKVPDSARNAITGARNPENNQLCDPDVIVDLVFGGNVDVTNRFGFTKEVKAATDLGRPDIGRGPMSKKSGWDVQMSQIPQRFLHPKSRTSIAVPSDFDPALLLKSTEAPSYKVSRKFVFGLSTKEDALNSGDAIHVLTAGAGKPTVVYASAALGIVHNTETNTQTFFEGHSDDIVCISVSRDKSLVASGQVGKRPAILIWEPSLGNTVSVVGTHSDAPNRTESTPRGLVSIIGQGFFDRGVCAVDISFDNKFVVGVGCDDKHELGIWNIASGVIITAVGAVNGVPPQVRAIRWASHPVDGGAVTPDHADTLTDFITTIGPKHCKFWSFKRPKSTADINPATLSHRSYRMAKNCGAPVPSEFTCVDFIDQPSGAIDVVTGGDNGYVYLWRGCICVKAFQSMPGHIPGPVITVRVHGNTMVVSGSKGVVKLIDCASHDTLVEYSALPQAANARGGGGGGSVSGSNPITAGITIGSSSSSSSSRPGGASPRPSTASRSARGGGVTAVDARRPMSAASRPGHIAAAGGGVGKSSASSSVANNGGKKTGIGPQNAWLGPGGKKKVELPSGAKGNTNCISSALILSEDGRSIAGIVVITGTGRMMHINNNSHSISTLCFFHYGTLWALAVDRSGRLPICLTSGEDKWISVWAKESRQLVSRVQTPTTVKSLDIMYPSGRFVAVGMVAGLISIFELYKVVAANSIENCSRALVRTNQSSDINYGDYQLRLLCNNSDISDDIQDIKFSPNAAFLAAGSRDNCIYIYSVATATATLEAQSSASLTLLKRLRGHSSSVTHIDWSLDSRLLKSNCSAYELLFWDVAQGKQFLSSQDALESDTDWFTDTCVLGFPVMGIWPKNSDGTDINAVDISQSHKLVATADDFGKLKFFNYPCVAKSAPAVTMTGHSSHVTNVKFFPAKASSASLEVVSIGGHDRALMLWKLSK